MRHLPWLQEAARREPASVGYLLDCTQCRNMHSREARQYLGCGYEPPLDVATMCIPVTPWTHQGFGGDPATTCPGYTCSLPEVLEVARGRLHWSKGQLLLFTGGDMPSANLLRGIEILDGESHRVEAWLMTPKEKGGGGS